MAAVTHFNGTSKRNTSRPMPGWRGGSQQPKALKPALLPLPSILTVVSCLVPSTKWSQDTGCCRASQEVPVAALASNIYLWLEKLCLVSSGCLGRKKTQAVYEGAYPCRSLLLPWLHTAKVLACMQPVRTVKTQLKHAGENAQPPALCLLPQVMLSLGEMRTTRSLPVWLLELLEQPAPCSPKARPPQEDVHQERLLCV